MKGSALTGIKDVDMKIVNMLDDYELGKVCQANKYINNEICNSQTFWRNRVLNKFGPYLGDADFIRKNYMERNLEIKYDNWKDYYKYLMKVFETEPYITLKFSVGQDVGKVAKIMDDNNDKLIQLHKTGTVKEVDDFLNQNFLVSYRPALFINYRPDLLRYYLQRTKTDIRFFPLFREGGRELLTEYAGEEPLELLEILIEDPRIDPTNAVMSIVTRLPDKFRDLVKSGRITSSGLLQQIIELAENEDEEYINEVFPILFKYYNEVFSPDSYREILIALAQNDNLSNDFYVKILKNI